jgi:aminoglycoside 6'-N-acetyltransferase I
VSALAIALKLGTCCEGKRSVKGMVQAKAEGVFKVRPALQQDAEVWLNLRCELWPEGAEDHESEIAEFFKGSLREPLAVLVAVDAGGDIVGFAELSIRRDVPSLEGLDTGFIEGLYVTPKARLRGIARALIRASRDWARNENCLGLASDRSGRYTIDRSFQYRGRARSRIAS